MGQRHYSPDTPLELAEGDGATQVAKLARDGRRVGWMTLVAHTAETPAVMVHRMSADPNGYAAQLYVALHALDVLHVDVIVADLPPETDEWLGVRDRLQRAAAR